MQNLRLWERYAADMMCSMIEQTVKQTDALQKQVEENMDSFVHTLHPPPKKNGTHSELNGHEVPALPSEPPPPEEPPAAPPSPPPPEQERVTATPQETEPPETCKPEPVWTFRGYQLEAGNFTNAMVHFFRAESIRADVWRRRLDTTTNWAVITTGATLSIAWDPQVIILSTLLVTLFLYIEARRYCHYELWSYRIRLMETDFFAAMLVPPFRPAADWAESLADNLLRPKFPISMWEAFGRRFRHNYVWIYIILWLAWILNIWLHPEPAVSVSEFISRAAIGTIPAWVVLAIGVVFNGILIVTGLLTRHLKDAPGEVLPREGNSATVGLQSDPPDENKKQGFDLRAWCRPTACRKQTIAFIITDHPETVAENINQEMKRGVTSLSGTGIHSQDNHNVLMCALTVTEVDNLKRLISRVDPGAFVMLSDAQKVYGNGFLPLQQQRGTA